MYKRQLQALSRSGRSRPFHRDADGLVPAEGAAILVLRRLDDAIADDNTILGVIRGIGLSNDGRGRGLLVPSQEGQERAMRLAYEMADLEPVSYTHLAMKLACDRLHDRTADVMLAGGVNGASNLLLHVGFSALQALSRSINVSLSSFFI